MRGRKPVPTMLRKLHGNPRKVALPKHEPQPVGDLSDAPEWLTNDQKLEWAHAVANAPPGLLKLVDRSALAAWAVAVDLHRQAVVAQSTVPLLVRVRTKATMGQNDPGVPTASPYINIINQQAKVMLKAASELGFTPVSRPRIYAGVATPDLRIIAKVATSQTENSQGMSLDEFLASAPTPPVRN